MAFQRRNPRTRKQKIRETLWPTMGFRRLVQYYKHYMGRLPGTPYFTAVGFATGIAVSFTPFIGLHVLLGAVITWLLRGSLVAMAVGTILGNPWTSPLIWLATYKVGKMMLGRYDGASTAAMPEGFTFANLLDKPMELLLPMTLGSIPFVIMSWIISFYFVRQVVKRYKEARNARIRKHD